MEENKKINAIRYFRGRKGWTMKMLADKSGISVPTLSVIEHSESVIGASRIDTMYKILNTLGVSFDELVAYEKEEEKSN